ncbi:penicillin-binding protein activator [Shigella boydii]
MLLRAFTEDEARDAARHIRDQGKQAPLVLIPRSSLGNRVANAFAQEWQKTGQRRVVHENLVPPANYARVLTAVLVLL